MNAAYETGLIPIIVVHSGRAGSTLLMQLLGTSDRVAFDRRYAFENAYLAYFWQWARAVELGATGPPRWRRAFIDHPRHLEQRGLIGGPPFANRDLLSDSTGTFWHRAFRSIWREFSDHATGVHAESFGVSPTHYAEKGHQKLTAEIAEILTVHRVHLVRDPRDQLRSIFSFIERTGSRSFGFQEDDTPGSFAERFVGVKKGELKRIAEVPGDDPLQHVVRYEDLVADLSGVASCLGDALALRFSAERVRADEPSMAHHITSASPEASVGAWHAGLAPDIADLVTTGLGDQLARFGYD